MGRAASTADALAARIRSGLLTFVAGDALGVPWEGRHPGDIDLTKLDDVPERDGWERGVTSDDTAQMLLVAEALSAADASDAPLAPRFLGLLDERFEHIRGAGPTTTAAIERFRKTGQAVANSGSTNGAAMRALPLGWAFPAADVAERRAATAAITRTTHGTAAAVEAANVVAAMAAVAVDGAPKQQVIASARAEARTPALHDACDGSWRPPRTGITLDAIETVAAVISAVATHDTAAEAMRWAVSLGGDTDTVAAITGGILGCRSADAADEIPWLSRVELPAAEELDRLASVLAQARRRREEQQPAEQERPAGERAQ